jgi:uncharacterized protein (DUF2237 family)
MAINVMGGKLEVCGTDPMTGFYRSGCCDTGPGDYGLHLVCAQMTADFLRYSRAQGNDLTTPAPVHGFSGLKPGDRWCLCVERWKEALDANMAPPVFLAATHVSALEFVALDDLKRYALDATETP